MVIVFTHEPDWIIQEPLCALLRVLPMLNVKRIKKRFCIPCCGQCIIADRAPPALYISDAVGLGHARLSIIDLSGGYQPIHNEDRTVWIVFKGEILNYPELRTELSKRGHSFYTQSDTEVISHLDEEHGPDVFKRLNGQFAIAIWDRQRQSLLLGRDRMGIRPLFYHQKGTRLHFASEIKALLTDTRVPRRLNGQTLADVFTCWTPVDPMTAFDGIQQLPPGHLARLDRNGLKIERYWQLDFSEADEIRTPVSWAEEMQALLVDAARIRLRADVPVGAYLSGGIDSTYISTLVKRNFNNRLNTFSVQFADKRYDESSFQQTAIAAIQTDHRAIQCSDEDIGNLFPRVIWHTEVPMIRTAPAPLMMLSGLVRQSDFKVVLTGEGADEIFAGYNIFNSDTGQPNAFLFGFFKKGLMDVDSPVYSHLVRWQNTSHLKNFFSDDLNLSSRNLEDFTGRIQKQLPARYEHWTPLAQAQYLESTLFLSNYLLSSQGDRMAMANSIEGRFPFLDHRVVELAARMPANGGSTV